jgi:hypothetical protein
MTVDQWIEAEGMHTIELSSPRGKLWLTKSIPAYKRLVAAGEVAFSPLEVERFVMLVHRASKAGKSAINEKLLDHIYSMKKQFGARLTEMKLDLADWPQEEMEDGH